MKWTPRIEMALRFAGHFHDGQTRGGDLKVPCLTHLVAVATIVSEYTNDEDIIVAALLHDAIEDTQCSRDQIKEEFGDRVLELVLGVTAPEWDKDLTWEEKKDIYRENLEKAPADAAFISAADKIHNFYSARTNFKTGGYKKLFKEDIQIRKEKYQEVVNTILSKLNSPIAACLEKEFELYIEFLNQQAHED